MTVTSENAYNEHVWTGVETSFNPGFSAADVDDVVVQYLSAAEIISDLTYGVHYSVTLGAGGAVTVTPIALPAAPGTLLISRDTPALQETAFANLTGFSPAVHETLHDRAMRISAEIRRDLERHVGPWTIAGGVVNFQPYQLAAADPTEEGHVATRGWVLEVTGILSLEQYVTDAQAAAASAATAQTGAVAAQTGSVAAKDEAQLWAVQTEDTPVTTGPNKYSALHHASKAAASAALAATYAALLANPDYGTFSAGATDFYDYGSTWT